MAEPYTCGICCDWFDCFDWSAPDSDFDEVSGPGEACCVVADSCGWSDGSGSLSRLTAMGGKGTYAARDSCCIAGRDIARSPVCMSVMTTLVEEFDCPAVATLKVWW